MGASDNTAIGARMAAAKRRRMRIVIVAAVAVALLGAGAGLWLFSGGAASFYDATARTGQAPTKTPEEIQAELNRVVEEGMFNISIASTVDFPAPGEPGTAYIENVPANRYDMRVSIALDGTGETVYESGAVAPGNYIECIRLNKALAPGNHAATATFTALDRDTHEKVGQAAARVTLAVREG